MYPIILTAEIRVAEGLRRAFGQAGAAMDRHVIENHTGHQLCRQTVYHTNLMTWSSQNDSQYVKPSIVSEDVLGHVVELDINSRIDIS